MKWFRDRLPLTLAALLIAGSLFGGATFSRIKTWITGETLTASDLNAEFNNILNNFTFSGLDDYSATATEMRSTADPYPASSESLATSGAGELERLRYVLAQITGETYWYQDPDVSLATVYTSIPSAATWMSYRRPVLKYVSATTVDVENNTGTANETRILFPDGNIRSVTEDTSSTSKYRRFIITETAEFTSGTENSGMLSGEAEANNKWYAVYAVKSSIDSSKFVLAASTSVPVQANYSTINTRFGTNAWVYLGLIRNGDSSATAGDILKFHQSGATTIFANTLGSLNAVSSLTGILEGTSSGATTVTVTYTAGTGDNEYPGNIGMGLWSAGWDAATTDQFRLNDGADAVHLLKLDPVTDDTIMSTWFPAPLGVVSKSVASNPHDISLSGFTDTALGVGPNPQL